MGSGMGQFLGEMRLFAFESVPQGWGACEGQLLAISQNTALFSLLGMRFGGDGKTNFALPDMRGKAAAGMHYCIALEGDYPKQV
jgi:microcystin-dependent protein